MKLAAYGEDIITVIATAEIQGELNQALARILTEPPGTGAAKIGAGSAQGARGGRPSDRKGTVLRL